MRSVAPEHIPGVWGDIAPLIEKALKHAQGEMTTLQDTYAAMRLGWIGTWVVLDGDEIVGVLGYEQQKNPGNKVLFLNFVAGRNFDDWVEVMERMLIKHKEQIGYDVIWSSSRAGMMKKLKKRGWKVKSYIMEAPNG